MESEGEGSTAKDGRSLRLARRPLVAAGFSLNRTDGGVGRGGGGNHGRDRTMSQSTEPGGPTGHGPVLIRRKCGNCDYGNVRDAHETQGCEVCNGHGHFEKTAEEWAKVDQEEEARSRLDLQARQATAIG